MTVLNHPPDAFATKSQSHFQLSFAAVTLPNGKKITTQNVTLFLNRVNGINQPFWVKKELGVFENEFAPQILTHGAGMYKISPIAN